MNDRERSVAPAQDDRTAQYGTRDKPAADVQALEDDCDTDPYNCTGRFLALKEV